MIDLQLEEGTGGAGAYAGRIIILTNHGTEPFLAAPKERAIADFLRKTAEFDLFPEQPRVERE